MIGSMDELRLDQLVYGKQKALGLNERGETTLVPVQQKSCLLKKMGVKNNFKVERLFRNLAVRNEKY